MRDQYQRGEKLLLFYKIDFYSAPSKTWYQNVKDTVEVTFIEYDEAFPTTKAVVMEMNWRPTKTVKLQRLRRRDEVQADT
jgi:hypothetical protein